MKKENPEDHQIFYLEIPQTDYLGDIEIQDEYDSNNYDDIQGLSDQQVSEIARDSLDAAHPQPGTQRDETMLLSEKPQKSN